MSNLKRRLDRLSSQKDAGIAVVQMWSDETTEQALARAGHKPAPGELTVFVKKYRFDD